MANKAYIEKLEEMVAKGILRATWKDRTVEFASFEELRARIEYLESRQNKTASHVNPTYDDGVHR